MSPYRVAINVEWTGKCNARCVMCPREAMPRPEQMQIETYRRVVERLRPEAVFRAVIAGYGEPTTHPRFDDLIEITRGATVPVDMVTNGQLLDEPRLRRLDGTLNALIVSFSSVVPEVYERVHVNLDHDRVMGNIATAQRVLRRTRLAISLTPLSSCLDTLPRTIAWLRAQGVALLTMSPTLYDRAGAWGAQDDAAARLRGIIRRFGLRSQELDFIPSVADIVRQWRANRHRCIPRNADLAIAADGSYQYCFNDIRRRHAIGRVDTMSVREALAIREREPEDPRLCADCGIRRRYGARELLAVARHYLQQRAARNPQPIIAHGH